MQERRTNIRQEHVDRAQYCPASDLLPRDGRITNLSERGIGLLVQEHHGIGERVTVSFGLSGSPDPITATGIARWSGQKPLHGRWYPLGVEWLPVEEATRNRIRSYLQERRRPAAVPAAEKAATAVKTPRVDAALGQILFQGGVVTTLVAAVVFGLWAKRLHEDNIQLALLIEQRNGAVRQLQNQTQGLETELNRTKAGLQATLEEVSRLDRQSEYFAIEMERLNRGLEDIRGQYAQLREDYLQLVLERSELTRQLAYSETQRLEMARQLTSVPDLRAALRDATAAQTAQKEGAIQKEITVQKQSGASQAPTRADIAAPAPTVSWIRVHEPQAAPNFSSDTVRD